MQLLMPVAIAEDERVSLKEMARLGILATGSVEDPRRNRQRLSRDRAGSHHEDLLRSAGHRRHGVKVDPTLDLAHLDLIVPSVLSVQSARPQQQTWTANGARACVPTSRHP